MKRIALFEILPKDEYLKQYKEKFKIDAPEDSYEHIVKPRRATSGSAGYDFVTPIDISLEVGQSVLIMTGIRAKIDEGWCLKVYPRSGLGTKYRCQLDNTVGIIDQDYYYSSNMGHIMIKITNDGKEGKTLNIKAGERMCQGIFEEFGITKDDEVSTIRDGGFGSTSM